MHITIVLTGLSLSTLQSAFTVPEFFPVLNLNVMASLTISNDSWLLGRSVVLCIFVYY